MPPLWNFFIIQKKEKQAAQRIFVFSSTYFLVIPLLKTGVQTKFYSAPRALAFRFDFKNMFYKKFWFGLLELFDSLSKIFFKKLKFKGKGYYIYKNFRNTITVQMGYSHIIRLFAFRVGAKFTAKTTIFLFGLNRLEVIRHGFALKHLKRINIFTGRGIRFSRQIIYKKTGKMSSYR